MAYIITNACTGCGSCSRICPTQAITGEKKKIHTIVPDLCIECGSCGRICPAGAVEDAFGIASVRMKKSAWLAPVFDLKACMACVICLDACPVGCLAVGPPEGKDPNGYPRMADLSSCLGCGLCVAGCPADAITLAPRMAP
ncbi:4Fe-4S binding protein [Desulfoluna sp.]|uniref:4Fe-4S binding protein n=1 Tax=Desulfoluna sp. TaxID=2045199 RepID=UPI002626F86E|nr:4Fe-4S binding protein [Desulfoluna sp.]